MKKELNIEGTELDFYKLYINIFSDAFKLTKKEIEVLASILKVRQLLSEKVKDKELLNGILFSSNYKNAIAKEAGIPKSSLETNYIPVLKKKGIIKDSGIHSLFIVTLHPNQDYTLKLNFHVRSQN